ncbi:MAG: bifunctional phosphopantothenoylcysteine decarboxylase/phosphopantothenate--cysteine ligase CoaBC [Bacteroidota bacterium]|nr:bifunctional phosphopantothenoylcysteine decarboxylase/phosphopantothenate--cysteine ligase CoaBC [Bacteroidota bacterium]
MVLRGKKVILGISASIAAYKSAFLVRLLVKAGAEVRVVQTPASRDFVTPLTLSTLSRNEVLSDFTDEKDENAVWNNHVDLALWADLILIAPATSNTMAKMANGECDNLLMGVYLSAKCPVYLAPAMDLDMYRHPATRENMERLASFGNVIIPAGSGELASGLVGEGRMAEPEEIIDFLEEHIKRSLPLHGKKVLINGGPTYEPIDAVRFIGNHSSGKMGYALARSAVRLGADVTLVMGPTHIPMETEDLDIVRVMTTDEMDQACIKAFHQADITILSAAVSDFKPKKVAQGKLKKNEGPPFIELEPTTDILSGLGKIKRENQILVGFALEKENEEEYALDKLERKNLDLIVMNSLRDEGAGFGHDTNKVTLFNRNKKREEIELMSKEDVADHIWKSILEL